MDREKLYQEELTRLNEIFSKVDPLKVELTEGLRQDAAYLKAENAILREIMKETGMVKVHPEYPELQKPTEAAKQYLKNINSYSIVIKALNSVLTNDITAEDDEFVQFLKKMHKEMRPDD